MQSLMVKNVNVTGKTVKLGTEQIPFNADGIAEVTAEQWQKLLNIPGYEDYDPQKVGESETESETETPNIPETEELPPKEPVTDSVPEEPTKEDAVPDPGETEDIISESPDEKDEAVPKASKPRKRKKK